MRERGKHGFKDLFFLVAESLEEGGVFPVEAQGGPLLAWVGLGLSIRFSKKSKHLQKLKANLQAQMLPVQDLWYLFYPTDGPLLHLEEHPAPGWV